MAARRRRGHSWRSSNRTKAKTSWFEDSAQNFVAPTTGTVGDDPLLASTDWSFLSVSKEKATIKRIILAVGVYCTNPLQAAPDVSLWDVWLDVAPPDVHASNVTAAIGYGGALTTSARVIRGVTKTTRNGGSSTAVGYGQPQSGFQISWNLRTNIRLTDPDGLYLNIKHTAVEGTSEAYEYWFRSRVLYVRHS